MKVAITGSSGLIGQALTQSLTRRGDHVVALERGKDWNWQADQNEQGQNKPDQNKPDQGKPDRDKSDSDAAYVRPQSLADVEAVIHLAGEKIVDGRWNDARKSAIRASRVQGTRAVATALAKLPADQRPHTLLCASAIGYYGSQGDHTLTESASPGQGFLAQTCELWEQATTPASDAGIRVVNLRIGLVLAKQGGALAKMLPVFKLGGGGVLGNGQQYWSWITIDDITNACHFLLDRSSIHGPVNLVAPQPVTNRRFTQVLGRTLQRPTFVPVPAIALRLAMGEMVDELLLSSARVEPAVLQDAGYEFEHPQLDEALRYLLK